MVSKALRGTKAGASKLAPELSCERYRSHAECVHSCAQLAAGMNTEIHRGATPEGAIPGGRVVGADPADTGIDCKY